MLLTYHKKSNGWFQVGGHCDGEQDVLAVALREAREETGLKSLKLANDGEIFSVDIHEVGKDKNDPHFHYDIDFLLEADMDEPFVVDEEESEALQWFSLREANVAVKQDKLLLRMLSKLS